MVINPQVGAALVTGGASLASGLMNLIGVGSANKQNVQMQRETNALQYQMMKEQNEWNRQQAIDMFNLEANYNSPINQMKRLKEAGLNPAVAFANNTQTSSGNSNVNLPASVSVPSVQSPHVQPLGSPLNDSFDNVLKIAQAIGSVSQAKKSDAERQRIITLLGDELVNLQQDAKYKEAQTILSGVMNDIQEFRYFSDVEYYNNERNASIQEKLANAALHAAQKDLTTAEKDIADIEKIIKNNEKDFNLKHYGLILTQIQEAIKLLKAQQTQAYSTANLNNANAQQVGVQTDILRESKDDLVKIRHAEASKNENEAEELRRTLNARIIKAINESGMSNFQRLYWRQQWEKASKQNAYYELELILDAIPFVDVVK